MIPDIEWEDGYPTEESVSAVENKIETAPSECWEDMERWIRDTLRNCAANCCAFYEEEEGTSRLGHSVIKCYFSTGGWSGAEEVIGIIENDVFLSRFMEQWNRGGHYIFEFKTVKK